MKSQRNLFNAEDAVGAEDAEKVLKYFSLHALCLCREVK